MRILFSSTKGAGHMRPLLPYLHALRQRGHEVCDASPESASALLQKERLPHAPFDRPDDEQPAAYPARVRGLSDVEIVKADVRELFAGLNPKAALPNMRETIRAWRPDLIVRESAEFAAAIAADEAGIPHARGGALRLC